MSATGAAARVAPNADPHVSSAPTSPSAIQRLLTFWRGYAFSVGAIDFQHIDVALAAMVFGEWSRFERRLAEGLACMARATAESSQPPQSSIDEAAIAFRYARDLISGEDIAAWLDGAGISTEEWMASVTRDVLRKMWADDIEELLDRYGPSPRQLESAALAEGICSGLFDEFERSFSGKAAIAFEASESRFQSRPPMSASHADAAIRFARQHAHWLEGLPPGDALARLRIVLEIQDLFNSASSVAVDEASLLEVIEANRLEWVVIESDTLSFADESAAREAMLCVTEDRLSLADVGGLSRQPMIRTRRFLGGVPAEYRHRLLAVEPGQIIGPLSVDGRFHVTVVTGRTAPTLSDEDVAQRARTVLLEQVTRRAARDHVRRRSSG